MNVSFEFALDLEAVQPELTSTQEEDFKSDFRCDLDRLCGWSKDNNWSKLAVGILNVSVSPAYQISKSLVPAWYGRTGHMEFPAWRVRRRQAAIAHELAHVFFPNGNRLLAEGLAVYLQAAIGGNPAFPNFGRPLHELADEVMQGMMPASAPGQKTNSGLMCLPALDPIATPSPLVLTLAEKFYGEDKRGQAYLYALAGSFVQFLIESRGLDMFRAIYAHTPLVPLTLAASKPSRWADVYGVTLTELEAEWLALLRERFSAVTGLRSNLTNGTTMDRENGHA